MRRIAVLALAAAFIMASCSSSSDGGPAAPTTTEMLEGTYVLQRVDVTDQGMSNSLVPPAVDGQAVFTPDGRFSASFNAPVIGISGAWTGGYLLSGTVLTLNYDDGDVEIWTITADRSQISTSETEGTMTVVIIYVRT